MFKDMVEQTAEQSGRTPIVVEKDYYVTLILKLLSEQLDLCVFMQIPVDWCVHSRISGAPILK